jgi:hypothetical protein
MFCDEFVDTHLRHLSIYHWNKDEEKYVQGAPKSAFTWHKHWTNSSDLFNNCPQAKLNLFGLVSEHKERFNFHWAEVEFIAYTIGDGFFSLGEMKKIMSKKCPNKKYIGEQVRELR